MKRLPLLLVAVCALGARPARSQSIEASATTFTVQSHIRFANSILQQNGQWIAGEGALRVGLVRLGMSAALGSLNGSGNAAHPDRRGRTSSATVHVLPMRWAAIGAIAEAKRFETDAGPTIWRLIGANLRLTPALDSSSLEGLADVSYWPMATIVGGQKMPLAFRAVLGATYRVAGGPLRLRLAYRFERFDFETQGGDRLEQFRGATLGALLRFDR
jgi:hypothetical protein